MQRPLGITVSRHIMESQRLHPEATGALSGLLSELVVAAKTISMEVKKAGLGDILGLAGGPANVQGEAVQKLDVLANSIIKRRMARCGYLCVMTSEEDADAIPVLPRAIGKYTLAYDPLDGSSNIDVNVSIGTIFSIHRRRSPDDQPGTEEDLLQPGRQQIAAGYIIYGSSTMLVYTTGEGVHGFTLDPGVGEFFLSHPDLRIPERGKYFSVNEGNHNYWDANTRRYIDHLKALAPGDGRPYSSRYIGSLVADFHRNLITGGIFLYPKDSKSPSKPHGKLRLLYEAAPLAFIAEQAGGRASTGAEDILDIQPTNLHERVPLIIGSRRDVNEAELFLRGDAV
ncbi:MAG: class 1 fructose-bisphosphatase [Thermodesulfobacteriota bacterium]